MKGTKGRVGIVRFTIEPGGRQFAYPDIFKNIVQVWGRIDQGADVEVLYAEASDGLEVWGLRLAGEEFLTPKDALAARRKNGLWGAVVGVGFLAICRYVIFVEGRRNASK